jgi:hypothetical protein
MRARPKWRTRSVVAYFAIVMISCALTGTSAVATEQPVLPSGRPLDAVLEKWRCAVSAYVEKIHSLPLELDDRYLALWPKRRPEYYVQCIFHDDDRQIYCEAASGFYRYADRIASYATPQRLQALARLGFSTDGSKGNFSQDRDFHGASEVATLMLETLASVFELGERDVLEFDAPQLSKHRSNRVKADAACALIS